MYNIRISRNSIDTKLSARKQLAEVNPETFPRTSFSFHQLPASQNCKLLGVFDEIC
jgi:hypothetical protein